MAVMNIEGKNKAYLWQLIITGVIIGLVAWGTIEFFDRASNTERDKPPEAQEAISTLKVVTIPIPLDKYLSFIRNNPAQEKMDLNHAYTSGGIRRLADAIGAVVDQQDISKIKIKGDLDKLRNYADQLEKDHASTDHADVIREAFVLASDVMDSIEQQISPHLDSGVDKVRRAAGAIDPGKRALEQKTEVETFFDRAGRVLEVMAKRKA